MDQVKRKRGRPPKKSLDTIAGPSNELQVADPSDQIQAACPSNPSNQLLVAGPSNQLLVADPSNLSNQLLVAGPSNHSQVAITSEADDADKTLTLPIFNVQGYSDEEEMDKEKFNLNEIFGIAPRPGEDQNLNLNEMSGLVSGEEMEKEQMDLNEPPGMEMGTENLNLNEVPGDAPSPTGKEIEESEFPLCLVGEDTGQVNLNLNEEAVLGPYPPGELRVMAGAVDVLCSSIRRKRQNPQLKDLVDFCRDHKWGYEKINGQPATNGAVRLVVLNVPSGTPVYGVSDGGTTPSWNNIPASLIRDAMLVASTILVDNGWFVCIHTMDQLRKVDEAAAAAPLKRAATFTLLSNLPIYCHPRPPHLIYTLLLSVFHRSEVTPEPKPYYLEAAQLRHGECSLTRDTMLENMNKNEWLRRDDGMPRRGGAQRSDNIWRFIVLAFTKYGDSVVDLIAGTGGLLKVASKLGRHALGIEQDYLILEEVLKPSQLIQ